MHRTFVILYFRRVFDLCRGFVYFDNVDICVTFKDTETYVKTKLFISKEQMLRLPIPCFYYVVMIYYCHFDYFSLLLQATLMLPILSSISILLYSVFYLNNIIVRYVVHYKTY